MASAVVAAVVSAAVVAAVVAAAVVAAVVDFLGSMAASRVLNKFPLPPRVRSTTSPDAIQVRNV